MPGQRWTKEAIESLIRQVVSDRKNLPDIYIPGKSQAAVNNQRRRLKEAQLLNGSFAGRRLRPWTICQLKKLEDLTMEYGLSADLIGQLQLIPGRSREAVSKMMGRHGLGSPDVKFRAQQAERIDQHRREDLRTFLLGDGRLMPSRDVAEQWCLAQKTVSRYRRRLGIALSWQQARSSDEFNRKRREQGGRIQSTHTGTLANLARIARPEIGAAESRVAASPRSSSHSSLHDVRKTVVCQPRILSRAKEADREAAEDEHFSRVPAMSFCPPVDARLTNR